jgi:putative cell wall-binding protein
MEEILSKSTYGLRRAGLAALAVSLTMGGALVAATPASADWAPAGGEIGIVDTDRSAPGTQGATLVYPGVAGQDLGDIRMVIPNSFQNGDTIDLTIFDRTATANSAGQINADAAHRLGFGGVPTVSVNPTPHAATTSVGPEWNSGPSNTEAAAQPEAVDPYEDPAPGVTDPATDVPTTPPVFTAELVQSSRANGLANDIIRLRVSGVQANNAPTAKWVVTLSDLSVTLGDAVSPGELRVVPFAYNGTPASNFSNASTMFQGNLADTDGDPATFDPTLGIYTVPAYVAPVSFTGGANRILADGTAQRVGDITISETNNYSLQTGSYWLNIDGINDIENDDVGQAINVTKSGGSADETVTVTQVDSDTLRIDIAGTNTNTSKLSFRISDLLVSDNSKGPISYVLTGGSIDGDTDGDRVSESNDAFLVTAGQSGAIGDAPPNGVLADAAFSPNVNQDDIVAPVPFSVDTISTALEMRIGGGDRYETAAKIALNNGANEYVVLASGENFPDALSSGYLANQVGGGSILLTRQASLPQPTLSAMRELGTKTVFVVGGPSAVSDAVVKQLRNTPQYYPGGEQTIGQGKLHVVRLAGANRYETNKKVNEYAAAMFQYGNPVGRTNIEFGESSKLTALVATGEGYADALAAGPATSGAWSWDDDAVYGNLPLILTRTATLDSAARSQMQNLGIEQAVVVGGPSAVSATVETAIEGLGADVKRIAGANRYETATKLADFVTTPAQPTPTREGGLGFDDWSEWDTAYLATGEKYADALAGAPLAGNNGSPLLLTRSATLSPETQTWLRAHTDYDAVIALGLGSAVAPAVLDAANAAIAGD